MKLLSVKYIFIYLFVLVVAMVVIFKAYMFYTFEIDSLLDPDPVQIELAQDEHISFDIKVNQSCLYMFGVGFKAIKNESDFSGLKNIFGQNLGRSVFPATIDISIHDRNKKVNFSDLFSVKTSVFMHTNNEIYFSNKPIVLDSGVYLVDLHVIDMDRELPAVNPFFYIKHAPKVDCD